jgi:hypothetical protein
MYHAGICGDVSAVTVNEKQICLGSLRFKEIGMDRDAFSGVYGFFFKDEGIHVSHFTAWPVKHAGFVVNGPSDSSRSAFGPGFTSVQGCIQAFRGSFRSGMNTFQGSFCPGMNALYGLLHPGADSLQRMTLSGHSGCTGIAAPVIIDMVSGYRIAYQP